MRDLGTLRERIDQAQQRMRVVQTARERESEALANMWAQIRTRFAEQEAELEGYRARVATLEDTHEELLKLVETLLGSIEGNLSKVADETVPHIASAAEDLLLNGTTPSERVVAMSAPQPVQTVPQATTRSSDTARRPLSRGAVAPPTPAAPVDDDDLDGPSPSPGIRDLIARVQRAVITPEETDETPADSELEKELQEIENLRTELQGLKRRISSQ